ASRAYASYAMVEKGSQQPRALSVAFFNPVRGEDQPTQAIQRLQQQRQKFERAYGQRDDERHYEMNVETGEGSLQELLEFVSQ
ncbi:type I-E CRISPR-associated protein Cas7/Cse4/CasC, partial [Serratia marcescens]|uniref:type I-E CRISPR-associated protein Cas7/Cse4/CasC n=1 Tax=Serratia marcescens TaxID=615 RepID=UPI001652EDDD